LLRDGTRHHYSRHEAAVDLFQHSTACLHADYKGEPRPGAPPILHAVARAKDRRAALAQVYPHWPTQRPFSAFDLHTLVNRGELVAAAFNPDFPMAEG
jgi:hypothetical protein